ncbi:M48 family metallopeptidase [Thalassotalea piscium]|nr:SprT family zinc-dependent metalloprotease [Thalassotalea piscium]
MQVIAGRVVVRAPLKIKEQYIEKLLENKSAWIEEKINQQILAQKHQNQLRVNGQMWFDGNLYPLNVTNAIKHDVYFDGDCFQVSLKVNKIYPPESMSTAALITDAPMRQRLKKLLERWLKCQAQQYLIPRTENLAKQTLLIPKNITIRQYKARWGSCNSLGNVQFNYLLMMAPKWVVDYVIVHELCHLKHLNHSPKFWSLVAQYSPNYLLAKQWLKKHQHKLQWTL